MRFNTLLLTRTRSLLQPLRHQPPKPSNTTTFSLPRAFTTTPTVSRKDIPHPHLLPENQKPLPPPEVVTQPPPYPYGPNPFYHVSNKGLYGFARIRYGNNPPPERGNKSRRTWRPNVQKHGFYSDILKKWIRTKATVRVIRTIDKVGGIDNYLLGGKTRRIRELGVHGWQLRWRLMQTDEMKRRMVRERMEMGLPRGGIAQEEERLRGLLRERAGVEREKAEAMKDTGAEQGRIMGGVGDMGGMGSGMDAVRQERMMREVDAMLEKEQEFNLAGGEGARQRV